MPCPAQELGAIAPLRVVSVAQAFLPVPEFDWASRARNEKAKECVGLCTAGLWPAFLNLGLGGTGFSLSSGGR